LEIHIPNSSFTFVDSSSKKDVCGSSSGQLCPRAMMRHKRLKHGESDVEEDEDVDMVYNSSEHSDPDNYEKKDNVVFSQMAKKAHDYTADEWQKKYDKYLKQNMPEKKTNSKADEKTRGETYKQF
jgi:hypothetical protein